VRRTSSRQPPAGEAAGASVSRQPVSSGARVALSLVVGAVASAVSARFLPWQAADLIGWDAATAVYLLSVWATIGPLDADDTERVAIREDPSIPLSELMVLSAAVACLGGVGMALVKAGQVSGGIKAGLIVIGVASILTAWGTVHTIYTLRYGRLYYSGRNGGIDFNGRQAPKYVDFAYVAFTIGMTFQVSDTDLTSPAVRRTALRHALLSYLFGAVIIGMTINIVASLLH
jgi:uncharacterized membrane protein